MSKKIGLAVCYDTKNYGSQLQVLATVDTIKKMGYDPEIIRYKKKITPHFIFQTIPRLFNLSFVMSKIKGNKRDKKAAKYPEIVNKIGERNKLFENFVHQRMGEMSPEYKGWEKLVKECKKNYDAFVCGSDQLWLPNNLGSHFYTLEFAPTQKRKISYATSFGVSSIPFFQKKSTNKYLKRFYALSTRELAGANIIKEISNIEAKVVCDPTMLLTGEEWNDVIEDKKIVDEPYIFCYLLGTADEHRDAAISLAKLTGLKIVTCPFLDNFVERDITFGDERLFTVDSADFVNLIRGAEYILTDSFHGTVFSILYQKKFVTFNRFKEGSNSRNSRIDSLCSILGLENRRYTGDINTIFEDVDYEQVLLKLSDLRSESKKYLLESLENL